MNWWTLGEHHGVLELDPRAGCALELHWVRIGRDSAAWWADAWGRWLRDAPVGRA